MQTHRLQTRRSLTTGAKPLNEGLSRFAIVLYIFFINMGSIHHLLADPGLTPWFRNINTSYMMYLAVLGSLIHGFSIPASIELGLREQGFRKGLFGSVSYTHLRAHETVLDIVCRLLLAKTKTQIL